MDSKPIVSIAAVALVAIALSGWMFAAPAGNDANETPRHRRVEPVYFSGLLQFPIVLDAVG